MRGEGWSVQCSAIFGGWPKEPAQRTRSVASSCGIGLVTHFEFASAVGAVYDRALFFSSITSSGCYEKSCAVIDRAYSRRKIQSESLPELGILEIERTEDSMVELRDKETGRVLVLLPKNNSSFSRKSLKKSRGPIRTTTSTPPLSTCLPRRPQTFNC
jgi:hypothetical protein